MSLATTANISGTFSGAAYGAAVTAAPQMGVGFGQRVSLQNEPSAFLDAFSSMQRSGGSQPGPADNSVNALQQRFDAALQSAKTWKPTSETINPNKVLNNTESFSQQHGQAKVDAADQMRGNQIGEIKAVMKEMAAAGATPTMPQQQGGGGGAAKVAGGMAVDAIVTGAATIALGPVGGLVATGLMAAKAGIQGSGLEGQGTLVTFNQSTGYFGKALSSRGKDNASAFESSAPSAPAASAPAQTAPVTNAFQQNMSKGPGFGRADVLADLQPRMSLTEQSLDQIAIKLADDSPAGKQILDMKENAIYAKGILRKQQDGVDATADNVARAQNIGMDPATQGGPKLQTFKM